MRPPNYTDAQTRALRPGPASYPGVSTPHRCWIPGSLSVQLCWVGGHYTDGETEALEAELAKGTHQEEPQTDSGRKQGASGRALVGRELSAVLNHPPAPSAREEPQAPPSLPGSGPWSEARLEPSSPHPLSSQSLSHKLLFWSLLIPFLSAGRLPEASQPGQKPQADRLPDGPGPDCLVHRPQRHSHRGMSHWGRTQTPDPQRREARDSAPCTPGLWGWVGQENTQSVGAGFRPEGRAGRLEGLAPKGWSGSSHPPHRVPGPPGAPGGRGGPGQF